MTDDTERENWAPRHVGGLWTCNHSQHQCTDSRGPLQVRTGKNHKYQFSLNRNRRDGFTGGLNYGKYWKPDDDPPA